MARTGKRFGNDVTILGLGVSGVQGIKEGG